MGLHNIPNEILYPPLTDKQKRGIVVYLRQNTDDPTIYVTYSVSEKHFAVSINGRSYSWYQPDMEAYGELYPDIGRVGDFSAEMIRIIP